MLRLRRQRSPPQSNCGTLSQIMRPMLNWVEKHSDTLITIATIIVAFAALVTIVDQRLDTQDELISQRFDA